MIQLFNIPKYQLPSLSNNILHDGVTDFECKFAEYVGAKYACGISSATNAIFLIIKYLLTKKDTEITIPTNLPPVVANAIILAGKNIRFVNNYHWIGHRYNMRRFYEKEFMIVDSAQECHREIFNEIREYSNGLMIFSGYPTKPVSGIDFGMVVSDDKEKIDRLRQLVYNGYNGTGASWDLEPQEVGWKMYMSSIQAWVANKSLDRLEVKQEAIAENRDYLNNKLDLRNTSLHLYRVYIKNRQEFINYMKDNGVMCGIHYKPLHKMSVYSKYELIGDYDDMEDDAVSIPFHEELTKKDLNYITELIQKWINKV